MGSQRRRRTSSKRRPRRAIQSPQEGSGNENSMGSLCEVWGSPISNMDRSSIQEPSHVWGRHIKVSGVSRQPFAKCSSDVMHLISHAYMRTHQAARAVALLKHCNAYMTSGADN
eukprot:849062-Pelagomonas_calceolata.AAC.2